MLEARKDHRLPLVQRAVGQEHFLNFEMEEVTNYIEQHLARENGQSFGLISPHVGSAMFAIDVRVAGALVAPTIEWEEPRLPVHEPCRHRHVGSVHSEVDERAALERQQWFVGWRAILTILLFGVLEGRPGQLILELECRDGNAIHECNRVDRVLVATAVTHLSRDRENVRVVASHQCRIDAGSGLEGT